MVNYPEGIWKKKENFKMPTNYANRGKDLERRVEIANEHYYRVGLGLIQFIETPMKQIVTGGQKTWVHAKKSTVDFFGTMKGGRSVAFDTKQTKLKTRFDLNNIGDHQMHFLQENKNMGGASFFLIEFTHFNKIFFVEISEIAPLYKDAQLERGPKSIKYEWFQDKPQVLPGRGVLLDYLKFVDSL